MSETTDAPEEGAPSQEELDRNTQLGIHAMAEAHDAKKYEECVAVGDAWLEARGTLPPICCVWYAQSLMAIGRPLDALPWAEVAAENMPERTLDEEIGLCAARSTYAQVLSAVGRFTKARTVMRKMVKKPVFHPETLEKQGHIKLCVTDRWREGWTLHESRAHNESMPDGLIRWDGKTPGRIAVLHEQGIGDAVLFARWMTKVAEVSGNPVVWFGPERELGRWIGGLPDVIVGERGRDHTPVDYACYSMSLPYLLGCDRPGDVPAPVAPTALAALRESYEAPISWSPRPLRVGVCWKGSASGWHDYERSFSFEEFAPVFANFDGVEFVNLCHGADVPDSAPFVSRSFADIYETGEVIAGIDLVVSVDTSVAHMAGSLNVPTLAIVPTKPDWRYSWPEGKETVFYPSVTVLRRKHSADLSVIQKARDLVEQFTKALKQRAA